MEVNANPLNRMPITEIVPVVAVKSAIPRFPTIPLKPGRECRYIPDILFTFIGREVVARVTPDVSRIVISTLIFRPLVLTIATAVLKSVSSQINVRVVEESSVSNTTASWSMIPCTLWR
jgi:hypothetical protein